jgi:hypothetical protein
MRIAALMEIARIIITHTPAYVGLVFLLLLVMGVRRLKPRRTHLALAALAPAGFLIWSLSTAAMMLLTEDPWPALASWGLGFALGVASRPIRTVPRPTHLGGWHFVYCATWQPLAFYMLLFIARYGLGIWAGFVPSLASYLSVVGLGLSAFTAGRTVTDFIPPLVTALGQQQKHTVSFGGKP